MINDGYSDNNYYYNRNRSDSNNNDMKMNKLTAWRNKNKSLKIKKLGKMNIMITNWRRNINRMKVNIIDDKIGFKELSILNLSFNDIFYLFNYWIDRDYLVQLYHQILVLLSITKSSLPKPLSSPSYHYLVNVPISHYLLIVKNY